MSRSRIDLFPGPAIPAAPWPSAPHARFADLPLGLCILGRIGEYVDTTKAAAVIETHIAQQAAEAVLAAPVSLPVESPVSTIRHYRADAGRSELPAPFAPFEPAPIEEPPAVESPEFPLLDQLSAVHDLPAEPLHNAPIEYRAEWRNLAAKLIRSQPHNRARIRNWHGVSHDGAATLWSSLGVLARCWSQACEIPLLVLDATTRGYGLDDYLGRTPGLGWSDVLTGAALLSQTLSTGEVPRVSFVGRGLADWTADEETALRLQAGVTALQRDYRAVWLVTDGAWEARNLLHAATAHERYLIVPPGITRRAWHDFSARLVKHNLLVHGWLAWGQTSVKSRLRTA